MQTFANFTEAYYALIDTVYNTPHFECAPRGQKIRECLGMTFAIQDPRNRLLYIPERKFSLQYVMAEILWYMLGENSTEWIGNYSSMWNKISDDGQTANSAYGARIFRPHPRVANGAFVQWEYVKDELKRDPDSRRAVIHIRTPEDSIEAKLDVPCTLSLQFFIRDNKLSLLANMRSTDLIFGLANDVPAFTFMQEVMANELGLELGPYIHVSNSLHVYERHFDMCEKILAGVINYAKTPDPMPPIPGPMPTENLNKLQAFVRGTESEEHIMECLPDWHASTPDSLWRDWGRILVLHRLNKLQMTTAHKLVLHGIENPQLRLLA